MGFRNTLTAMVLDHNTISELYMPIVEWSTHEEFSTASTASLSHHLEFAYGLLYGRTWDEMPRDMSFVKA
jgi:hypothetical protein